MSVIKGSKAINPIGVFENGHPVKVVVIDDSFIDRRIMTQILRSTGFSVVGEAEDGEAGVKMVLQEKPNMVILDYVMPKMNGLSALKEIKKRFPKIPIIMQTSESDRDLAVKLIKEGAADYIVKPLERAVVLGKFMKIVDKLNSTSQLDEI
ncbi:MAG: response regulator [Spirochaetales bacterium]|nr:response regulator [Spirochaetales bacterium]